MKIVRMTFTSPNPTSENPFETKPHLLHQDRHYLQGMAGGIRTNALIIQNLLRLYWQLGASPGNEYIIYEYMDLGYMGASGIQRVKNESGKTLNMQTAWKDMDLLKRVWKDPSG